MKQKSIYLNTKDYSVSGEKFQLLYNDELDMLETFPQPKGERLSEYYKSEDYISHTDSKKNLFEKVYHLVRSISLKKKVSLINSFQTSEKNLLDIGCGTGDFLQTAQINNWTISGVEPNADARKIANTKTNNKVFQIDQLQKFKAHSFDVITLWHVLEHLPELENQMSVFKKLLKPNGVLVIAVPNYKSYDALYYKIFWAAFDVPRHLWHFSKTSISKLVSKQNLFVEKTLPMVFDSFYVSMLSEKYKKGSLNLFNAFRVGLLSNLKAKRSKEYSSLIYVIKNS